MRPPPLNGRRATAAQRTVSLFTGYTDLESETARDGTRGQEIVRPRGSGRPAWAKKQGGWNWSLDQSGWLPATISYRSGEYRAEVRGESRTFESIIDAARWAERLS